MPGPPPPAFTDPYAPLVDGAVPLAWPATPVRTLRYRTSGTRLTALPNVLPVTCRKREGADPGGAVFRYDFSSTATGAPHSVEDAIDTTFTGTKVVEPGDELVIQAQRADGSTEFLFHGTALAFRIALAGDPPQEECTIEAVGIARTCWDEPIPGAVYRDGAHPSDINDVTTDLPVQCNPKGEPNAVKAADESGEDTDKYPVFLDPKLVRTPEVRRTWTVEMFARYLLATSNGVAGRVTNPPLEDLSNQLIHKLPNDDTAAFDPDDPATYTVRPITAPDTPHQGKDWPSTLYDLIRDYGFGFSFDLDADADGYPRTTLRLYYQQTGPAKPLYIDAAGSTIDRGRSNCEALEVTRDLKDIANEWHVVGAPERYEVSFILKRGFPTVGADKDSAAALATFDKSSPTFTSTTADKYRLYIVDECGDGHYPAGSDAVDHTPADLDDVLGAPETTGPDADKPKYCVRHRRALADLISLDDSGRPRKARLSISRAYTGTDPLWDGSGSDWQEVQGGWQLLKDRLGVRLTCDNPNKWNIGECQTAGTAYPGGKVLGVEHQNTAPYFALRLTCVVEGDKALIGKAKRRTNSPIVHTTTRQVDARDRYRKDTIREGSEFHAGDPGDEVPRDDTDAATHEAASIRATTEAGVLVGHFVIPHITTAYALGDRVSKIQGRETPLRTDGGGTGEAPVLPVVVGINWHFDGVQRTELLATDAGQTRGKYKNAIKARSRHV